MFIYVCISLSLSLYIYIYMYIRPLDRKKGKSRGPSQQGMIMRQPRGAAKYQSAPQTPLTKREHYCWRLVEPAPSTTRSIRVLVHRRYTCTSNACMKAASTYNGMQAHTHIHTHLRTFHRGIDAVHERRVNIISKDWCNESQIQQNVANARLSHQPAWTQASAQQNMDADAKRHGIVASQRVLTVDYNYVHYHYHYQYHYHHYHFYSYYWCYYYCIVMVFAAAESASWASLASPWPCGSS